MILPMRDKGDLLVNKIFRSTLSVMIVSTLTGSLGMLVDGILTGRFLGITSMTAYGLATPVFVVIMALMGIFTSGGQNRCAGYLSQGENEKLFRAFSTLCYITLLVGLLVMGILLLFMPSMLGLLGASASSVDLYAQTKGYYIGIVVGIPGIMLAGILQPIVQLDGDRARVFCSVITLTCVNILGDTLNVFLFHGGMLGMGLATSISEYVALVILLLHFNGKRNVVSFSYKLFEWKECLSIIKFGIPTANARVCNTLRTIALNNIILSIGVTEGVAALSAENSSEAFLRTISISVGFAVLMISSVFASEKDSLSLRRLLRISLLTTIGGGILIGAFVFAFAPNIATLVLKSDSEAIRLATMLFRMYAFCIPLNGINYMFINYLQGTGNIGQSNIVCSFNSFVFPVILAYILCGFWGITGVYLALPMCELLTVVTIVILAGIYKKKIPVKLADYDFSKGPGEKEKIITFDVFDSDSVLSTSEQIIKFADEQETDHIMAVLMGVFVEELGINIFKFNPSVKDLCINVRLLKTEDEFILRLRDNGDNFDAVKWYEIHNNCSDSENLGLKIVMGVAKSVEYVYSFQMNNYIIKM